MKYEIGDFVSKPVIGICKIENILYLNIKNKGIISSGEIGLPMENSQLILPCGIYGRWEK